MTTNPTPKTKAGAGTQIILALARFATPRTARQIRQTLPTPYELTTVSGRLTEMMDMGLVSAEGSEKATFRYFLTELGRTLDRRCSEEEVGDILRSAFAVYNFHGKRRAREMAERKWYWKKVAGRAGFEKIVGEMSRE